MTIKDLMLLLEVLFPSASTELIAEHLRISVSTYYRRKKDSLPDMKQKDWNDHFYNAFTSLPEALNLNWNEYEKKQHLCDAMTKIGINISDYDSKGTSSYDEIISSMVNYVYAEFSVKRSDPTSSKLKTIKDSPSKYQATDILIKLQNSYEQNKRLGFVFSELDRAYRDPDYTISFTHTSHELGQHITDQDIVDYFTFFESVYLAIKNKILTIPDIDDYFADRFFKFMHNTYIQENELYQVPSTYVNIFELYNIWAPYHISCLSTDRAKAEFKKNSIPALYTSQKLYSEEILTIRERKTVENQYAYVTLSNPNVSSNHEIKFKLKRLFPSDLTEVLELQNIITKDITDDDIFVKSSEEEILESMLIDCCYGLYHEDILSSVCIIVLSRNSNRNLACELNTDASIKFNYNNCLTFDSIQVRSEYRGYGIQKFFLQLADDIASTLNAKYIAATVSPKNRYSLNNFLAAKYLSHGVLSIEKAPYNGRARAILFKSCEYTGTL